MTNALDEELKAIFNKPNTIFTEDYEKLKSFHIPLPFLPIYYHNISRQLNVQSCGINPSKEDLHDIFNPKKIDELKTLYSSDPELQPYWKFVKEIQPGESLMDLFIKSLTTYPVAFDLICRIQLLSKEDPARIEMDKWIRDKENNQHPFMGWFENQENSICYHPAAMELVEKYLYSTFERFKPYVDSVKNALKKHTTTEEFLVPSLTKQQRKDFQENILTLFEVYFQNNEKLIVEDPKRIERYKSEKSDGSYTFNLEDPGTKQIVQFEILTKGEGKKQIPFAVIRNGVELLPWQDEAHPEFAKIFDETFLNEIFK